MTVPLRGLREGTPFRQIRHGWQRLRPIPSPRYLPGPPSIGSDLPVNVLRYPNIATLASAATSEEALDFVDGVLARLTPSDDLTQQQAFYTIGRAQFGRHFRYADLLTTLCAACALIRPTSYLEIGVRRGGSAAVVAAARPDCAIYGFDLWVPDYHGAPNPGPDFVRSELRAVGYKGDVVLTSGDSRETLPGFMREHPDLFFDLIIIDGDKSLVTVAGDFAQCLPRLKLGGIIVTDDLPGARMLRRVWKKVILRDSRYVSWGPGDAGGVAAAIRIGDGPLLAARRGA